MTWILFAIGFAAGFVLLCIANFAWEAVTPEVSSPGERRGKDGDA